MNAYTSGTAPHLRSTVARGLGWLTVTGMLAFALLGPNAGVVSAAAGGNDNGTQTGQGTGLLHDGSQGSAPGDEHGQGNGGSAGENSNAGGNGNGNGTANGNAGGNSDNNGNELTPLVTPLPATSVGVTPVDPDLSDQEYRSCEAAGLGSGFKIDSADIGHNGTYTAADGSTVHVTYYGATSFDFSKADPAVTAVLVKAGSSAYLFSYSQPVSADSSLYGPAGYDISHILFCHSAITPPPSPGDSPKTAQLTVTKIVVGGTAQPSDFTLKVGTTTVTSGQAQTFDAGSYTVSETAGGPANYVQTAIGGDCTANGSITLVGGDNKNCTITNTYVPPSAGSTPPTGGVGGATGTPQPTTTPIIATPTPTPGQTGEVAGASGTPKATPPSTNMLPGQQQAPSSDGWRLVLIAMAGFLASLLVLSPSDVRVRNRRR